MNVKDLVEKLQQMPADALVVVPNGEMGNEYLAAESVAIITIKPAEWNADILIKDDGGTKAVTLE